MTPEEIDKNFFILDTNKTTPVKRNEARYIYDFLTENKIVKTLEIGFGFGRSASHIIAATNSKHIVIDPFQYNYENYGLKNVQKLGMQDLLDFKADYSHNVLPRLINENKKFNFIFIDGSHRFDGIFIDFYYSDLLLEKDGYIMFHDTWMRSTQMVLSFIKKNREDYIFIKTPIKNLTLIQKIGQDKRSGMFFREFFTFKSIFLHNIKMWVISGKTNFIKSFILKARERLEN